MMTQKYKTLAKNLHTNITAFKTLEFITHIMTACGVGMMKKVKE